MHTKQVHVSTLFALVATLASLAKGQTVHMSWAAPMGGNGLSWSTAYNTLQPAIAAAVAGDEIWVAAGTYSSDTRMLAYEMKAGVETCTAALQATRVRARLGILA